MSGPNLQAALSEWWDFRCRQYLDRNFGRAGEEVRPQLTGLFFPPSAEATLPEQTLPISFLHLRLLGGEPLPVVQGRAELLGRAFGARGAKPPVGTLYLMLTALTSAPGRLSSFVRAQSAFFSLLLRRVAAMLDRGESEEDLRRELGEVWDIRGEEATEAALRGARGYWRRLREPRLGMTSLPFEPEEWMAGHGLGGGMNAARGLFPLAAGHAHLEAAVERLAAIDALREGIEAFPEEAGGARASALMAMQESLVGCLEGVTPWEAEALRPVHPLISSLVDWSDRLQLLGGGETPTAYAGRERLPDWLTEILEAAPPGENVGAAERVTVGGDTYLFFGVASDAPAEAAAGELTLPAREGGDVIALRVRFGSGEESNFRFKLSEGKDLLAAIRLAHQPDIRIDLFVRGEDGLWRFGASRYLLPDVSHRAAWLEMVLGYLIGNFGGEEDRIRLAILKDVKG